jgi:hypothetical protein
VTRLVALPRVSPLRMFPAPRVTPLLIAIPMTLRRRLLLVLAAAVVPASAVAQHAIEIQPGSRELDASRIAPRTDTMVVLQRVEGREVQLIRLEVRTARTDAGGGPVLVRTQRALDSNGNQVLSDSFTMAAATLAPLEYGWRYETGPGGIRVEGLSVRGVNTTGYAERVIDLRLSAPSFFRSQLDLLLTALPLAQGRAFGWRVLVEEEGRESRMEARVAGTDRVRTMSGGACDAWRVEVRFGLGASNYWIERGTGELLQYKEGPMTYRILRHRSCPSAEGTTGS